MDEQKIPAPTMSLHERHHCGNIITSKIIFAELHTTVRNGPFQMIDLTQWQSFEPVKATIEAKGTLENVAFEGIGFDKEKGFYCLQCKERVVFS